MRDGEERFAIAMSVSNLAWSDHGRRPVELVAAMAAATGLGSDLHRAKDMDPAALKRAILQLAHLSMRKGRQVKLMLSKAQAERMSMVVLFEQIHPQCRVCLGARVIITGDLKHVCQQCHGVGVHTYAEHDRAELCGIRRHKWHHWQSRYRMIQLLCQQHDTAVQLASRRLG